MEPIFLFVTCEKCDQPTMQTAPGIFVCPKCQATFRIARTPK